MTTAVETAVTTLDFSEVKYISVENLKHNFQDGTMQYCPSEIYVRRNPLSDAQLEKKKGYLVSNVDGVPTVQIREPLLFFTKVADEDFGDNLKLLNGNNRVRCEFLLLLSNPQYTFLDIPYRVITSVPTISQLIEAQDALNDSTDPHTVLDRAFKIVAEQKRLDEKYSALGLKSNAKKKRITEEIKASLHTDDATISYSAKLVSLPDFVLELIDTEKLAATTAVQITRILEKIKSGTLSENWQSYIDDCNRIGAGLFESTAKQYFEVVQPPTEQTETPPSTSITVPSNGSSSGESLDRKEKEPTRIDRKGFTDSLSGLLSTYYVIEPDHIKPEHSQGVAETVKTTLTVLAKLQDLLPTTEAIQLLTPVRDLLNQVASPEYLANHTDGKEESLGEFLDVFSGLSKKINNLYTAVYVPAEEKPKKTKKKDTSDSHSEEPTAEVEEMNLQTDDGVEFSVY